MTCLITAFDAFGDETLNSSAVTLALLPDMIGDSHITKVILPTSFRRAWSALERALIELAPQIVLLLGQAGGRAGVSLERRAVNRQNARIPDNDGAMPQGIAVLKDAPESYETDLPLDRSLAALRQVGIPAEISEDAGQFVCNATLFRLLHHKTNLGRSKPRAGFVHLPWMPVQAAEQNGGKGLDPEISADAVLRILRLSAEN